MKIGACALSLPEIALVVPVRSVQEIKKGKSWLQVGYGPWKATGGWFTVTEASTSSGDHSEHDNGLGATFLPGEVGTFLNYVKIGDTSCNRLPRQQ